MKPYSEGNSFVRVSTQWLLKLTFLHWIMISKILEKEMEGKLSQ